MQIKRRVSQILKFLFAPAEAREFCIIPFNSIQSKAIYVQIQEIQIKITTSSITTSTKYQFSSKKITDSHVTLIEVLVRSFSVVAARKLEENGCWILKLWSFKWPKSGGNRGFRGLMPWSNGQRVLELEAWSNGLLVLASLVEAAGLQRFSLVGRRKSCSNGGLMDKSRVLGSGREEKKSAGWRMKKRLKETSQRKGDKAQRADRLTDRGKEKNSVLSLTFWAKIIKTLQLKAQFFDKL